MSYDPQDSPRKPRKGPDQPGLFDDSRKLRRNSHPETSHEAARAIAPQLGELQTWALGVIRQHPGKTVSEMADELELRDPRKLGRRLNELESAGLIEQADERRCSITARTCMTWRATEQ